MGEKIEPQEQCENCGSAMPEKVIKELEMHDSKPTIWNPEKAIEGVFCPTCGFWMDDYEGQPEKCPKCSQKLSGWIDGRKHSPKLNK